MKRMRDGWQLRGGVALLLVAAATSWAGDLTVKHDLAFHLSTMAGALDASGNPATDGVDVQVWKDQSPNGRDFTPTYNTRRPTYQAGASVNGRPGLYYDGSMDILQCEGITAEIRSMFIVMKPETPVVAGGTSLYLANLSPIAYRETLELGENSGNFDSELLMIRSMNTNGKTHMSAYTSETGSLSGTVRLGVVFNPGAGAWDLYQDGVNVRNATAGPADDNGYVLTNSTFRLGVKQIGGNVFKGHLFEVIAYTNSLSASEIQAVDAYLSKRYVETDCEIAVSTTGRGAVFPSGIVATEIGATETFTITAWPGSHISDLRVNGVSRRETLGLNPKSHELVWSPVLDDGTLEVDFVQDETVLKPVDDLLFWYDSKFGMLDDQGRRAEPGDYVKTWRDRSPSAIDLFCGGSYGPDGRSPLLQGFVSPNGSVGLEFDGANDSVSSTNVTLSARTLVVAFAPTSSIGASTTPSSVLINAGGRHSEALTLGAFTTSYANEFFGIRSRNGVATSIQAAFIDAAGTIAGFTVISVVHDAQQGQWRLYQNGDGRGAVSQADEDGFVLSGEVLYLGSAAFNDFFAGHVFEVIGFSAALSDVERCAVESYLQYKYAQKPLPLATMLSIR